MATFILLIRFHHISFSDISISEIFIKLADERSIVKEAPLVRLKKKTTVEILWMYFLRLLSERPMCGYELMKEIERRFGWKPPIVTSYLVLQALRRDGYITVRKVTGRRRKTLYEITARGRDLFQKGKDYLRNLYRGFSVRSASSSQLSPFGKPNPIYRFLR